MECFSSSPDVLGGANPRECGSTLRFLRFPRCTRTLGEGEEGRAAAGWESEAAVTASCRGVVLVLPLFASAKFQGQPSEKLAGEKSF